jgi:GNAT superfamily N-acetyltransferase
MICPSIILFILLILILALILAFIINNALPKKLLLGGDADSIGNKYYYSIFNADGGLVYDELKTLLAQYNFHEEPLTKHVHVSFGSASGKDIYGNVTNFEINEKCSWWDPLFLTQKAVIKNTLGGHKLLSTKIKLYETIKKLVPIGIKYIPKTYTIPEFEIIDLVHNNVIYVLKKNNLDEQKGVRVFSEKKDYFKIKKELNIKSHNAIIMEYITNPALTIDGKKFHLRMHVLLIVESGIKRCYIHDKYRIYTASEKYNKSDWLNKQIHISCSSKTSREYKYPSDIANKIDENKFNEFKKTLAFAISFNESIIYEENNIGYMIYGVDVLITDDNNFFILEFNGTGIGHFLKCIKETPEGEQYQIQYSKDYFSFILNSTVFSAFGLKRRPIPYAEVCSTGILSPFFNILTGANRCVLIPYTDALSHEIEDARKIYFYNESIQLNQLLKICNLDNVFLLSGSDCVIGYLALDRDNYLTIVVVEEYQNRGIATAMIAQFLEIYTHRHIYTKDAKGSNNTIHMINKNTFIKKIANKLHFTLGSNGIFSRPCQIKDATINKVNNYELLTYNIVKENNGLTNIDLFISKLDKYMVATKSQFVHLAYSEIGNSNQSEILKASTGSKYGKNFVIQGSELKSVLNIKNTQIEIYKKYVEDTSLYRTYAKYKPYLYNGYRIDMHVYFFLYISKNGIKKCYYMDNITVKKSDILFEEELEKNKNYTMYIKDSDLQYKWPDTFLHDDKIGDIARGFSPNEKINNCLNLYIEEIADNIIQSNAIPYSESNSGFNIICTTIDFTERDNKYIPQIRNLFTHIGLFNNININDKNYKTQFSKYYYDFLINNIINPHFGLSSGQFILPLKCIVNTELHVDATVISKLNLQFNKHRNKIDIYLISTKIGHINLNIDNIDVIILSHIELLTSYRKKNIAVNVLFILMEILAAYYAPLNISLKMAFVKPMFHIAHTLQFHKSHWHSGRPMHDNVHSIKEEEYFIRLCRI